MPLNVQNVTISAGVVTVSTPMGAESSTGIYYVATEGGAETDDITQIQGLVDGEHEMIELRVQVDGDFWIIRHNPSNGITLQQEQDFETFHARDFIILRGIGTNAVMEVLRGRFGTL